MLGLLLRPLQLFFYILIYIYIYNTSGRFGLRRCANLGADGSTGSMSVLKIHLWPPCRKPLAELWVGRGSAVRPVLSVPVYSWTGLAWSLWDSSRSCLISLRFDLISLRSSLILLRSLWDPEISTDLTKLVDFNKDQLIYAKSSDVSQPTKTWPKTEDIHHPNRLYLLVDDESRYGRPEAIGLV